MTIPIRTYLQKTDLDRLRTAAQMLNTNVESLAHQWLTEAITTKLAPGGAMENAETLYLKLRDAKAKVIAEWKAQTGNVLEDLP